MLKVLVVDDSALMRRQIRKILQESGTMEVETARNGREALEQIARFSPNVVTLDINMPEMDGLTCLEHIMRESPCPVVMVSSLTIEGSEATIQALALGAVEIVAKPDGTVSLGLDRMQDELLAKVNAAAHARARPRRLHDRLRADREAGERRRAAARPEPRRTLAVTLIGVSTGGPRTLEDILPELPDDYPNAVVVAQHMPAGFTQSFARRLDGICAVSVVEVDRPMPLAASHVYIGRGDADVVIEKRLGRLLVNTVPAEASLWHPSVDRMVRSAMEAMPATSITGVQLTGMGDDGAEAMAHLKAAGGRTIAESEATATVFGMPGELIKRGGATAVLPSDRITDRLVAWAFSERVG